MFPHRNVFFTVKPANSVPLLLPFLLSVLQKGTEGFWKSVAHYVPREPTEIRILNPYFIQEAAFQFIGLPFNNGLMGKGVSGAFTSWFCLPLKAGWGSYSCICIIFYETFEGRSKVISAIFSHIVMQQQLY